MKKLIYISLLASASLFASCEDLLDAPSKSSMDETIIFNTEPWPMQLSWAFTSHLQKLFLPRTLTSLISV